jgi:dipeptidyl aminopeptidase/acylaminoacyl peptidase
MTLESIINHKPSNINLLQMKATYNKILPTIALLCIFLIARPCSAQQNSDILKDYKRANKFLRAGVKVNHVVFGVSWQKGGRLLYRDKQKNGMKFMIANPADRTKKQAFNSRKLISAISKVTGYNFGGKFPFIRNFQLSDNNQTLTFSLRGKWYKCDLTNYTCESGGASGGAKAPKSSVVSPDGKKAVFIKNWNLWMKNLKTGKVTQLTRDGKKYDGYGTNNAGWTRSKRPIVRWSPNSQRIATFQQDARDVGFMYLVNTKIGHPKLEKWKYEMPGDTAIFQIHRVIINLKPKPEVVHLKTKADPLRSTSSDQIAGRDGSFLDTQWSPDSKKLAFMSVNRGFTEETLKIANSGTGDVRTVMHETVEDYLQPGGGTKWHVLFKRSEILWYSQRSNWGHYYLYDLKTGRLKHQIGRGSWNMLHPTYIDAKHRKIYSIGSCKHSGNPYFHYLYRVDFSGKNLKLLTPETANHQIQISKNHKYFVDTYSTPTEPPITVLRNMRGKEIMTLDKADISGLKEMGWKPPIPIKVKARDGKTNLYGLMFKPSNFDSSKSYPIIDYIYPGPQVGSVANWSFSVSGRQALAELGFIVVEVNSLGTPGRSKSFQTYWYGNMHDNGIPDQVAAIKQLAKLHSWIDIDKVGIWGHSGGGFASTDAMFTYPDFFKVAVSESGNHDNRNYESAWGNKYQGLLKSSNYAKKHGLKGPYVKGDNYDSQANENYAKNLKGHLLLVCGLMDNNVPPQNTLLVVNALIKAHKDFNMFIIPNARHGYGYARVYWKNRRWTYFVKYLKGEKPPKDFELKG